MTKKRYACRKDRSFGMLMLISALVIWALAMMSILSGNSDPGALVATASIAISVTGLFLWLWTGTFYVLERDMLIAKAGPFIWRIPVRDIKFIRLNQKTIGGTWKPTLSWDCIEIRYEKSRSIFISPIDEDGFLSDLENMNHELKIKQK